MIRKKDPRKEESRYIYYTDFDMTRKEKLMRHLAGYELAKEKCYDPNLKRGNKKGKKEQCKLFQLELV